jgi:hypothetical protein
MPHRNRSFISFDLASVADTPDALRAFLSLVAESGMVDKTPSLSRQTTFPKESVPHRVRSTAIAAVEKIHAQKNPNFFMYQPFI